jgi:hypothetical protein
MTDARLLWVTRATGALIILFGVLLLFSLVSIDAETFGERFQRSGLLETAPQAESL